MDQFRQSNVAALNEEGEVLQLEQDSCGTTRDKQKQNLEVYTHCTCSNCEGILPMSLRANSLAFG